MSTESEYYPKDDHSYKTWEWKDWIMANGPLTEHNVMEYFEMSMFYDRSSNNQVLRMQTQHAAPEQAMNVEEELKRFTGMEYAVVHVDPPSLFIIQQQDRISPTQVRPMNVFIVLNNLVFPGPDLYTVLSTRLMNALDFLSSSLDTLRAARPDYTPRIGHIWPVVEPPLNPMNKRDPRQGSTLAGTPAAPGMEVSATKAVEGTGKPPKEDETTQPWEPFANAFVTTMQSLASKQMNAAFNLNNTGSDKLMVPPSDATESQDSKSKGSGTKSGKPSGGRTDSGGSAGGGGKPLVPTADGPSKQKGAPGPPGAPGAGKKKKRRLAANAAKAAAASTPAASKS